MFKLCCHQGVPIFKHSSQKSRNGFGIVQGKKGRQCRDWALGMLFTVFVPDGHGRKRRYIYI